MKVVITATTKGGVGKSAFAILLQRYARAAGLKVLLIDSDIQNSCTFYFADNEDELEGKSLAKAYTNEDLLGNIVTGEKGDFVPSSLNLIKLRAINQRALKKIIGQVDMYDLVIIDTPPAYDQFVLNAVEAADFMIVPFEAGSLSIKSAGFNRNMFEEDLGRVVPYGIVGNLWPYERPDAAEDSMENQYRAQANAVLHDASFHLSVPRASVIQYAIDREDIISQAKTKIKAYQALVSLFEKVLPGVEAPRSF